MNERLGAPLFSPSQAAHLAPSGLSNPRISEVSHRFHFQQLEKMWDMKHFLIMLLKLCPQETEIHSSIHQSVNQQTLIEYLLSSGCSDSHQE